jgi:hypothetical protein
MTVAMSETANVLLAPLTAQKRQSWVTELVAALLWVCVAEATLKRRMLTRQPQASIERQTYRCRKWFIRYRAPYWSLWSVSILFYCKWI